VEDIKTTRCLKATATLNGCVRAASSAHIEAGSSKASTLTNRDSAIDYYYASQLKGTAPVNDIHFFLIESRSFRVTLVANLDAATRSLLTLGA
jgi:hypothetical protein